MSAEIHVFGQNAWHDSCYIVGTRESLVRLTEVILEATRKKRASRGEFFTNDGEGYSLFVIPLTPRDMEHLRLPYSADYAADTRADAIRPWNNAQKQEGQNNDDA